MKSSPTLTALAPALAKAQAQFKSIHKDAKNPFYSSKFASLDNIMGEVRPVLATPGLSLVQGVDHPETVEGELACVNITTTLLHESGEWIQTDVVMPVGTTPIEKGSVVRAATAQTAGSAITYGRRYGVSAILALSTEDDDDGNNAGTGRAREPKPKAEKTPPIEIPLVTTLTPIDFGKSWRGKVVSQLGYEELEFGVEVLPAGTKIRIPDKWRPVFLAELKRRDDAHGKPEKPAPLTDSDPSKAGTLTRGDVGEGEGAVVAGPTK